MADTTPPNPPAEPSDENSGLPPRWLAKLKVEIDGYELIDRLDSGGQATVYKAIQKKSGKTVAIKVLHGGPHATDEARARLKREINALRAINHPNIVQAIAAGRTRSGLECLVMNFIDGKPLDALWTNAAFAEKVAPHPADLLQIFKAICQTVQAAHRKGITHRDLSPSNILIDAAGQPHILDFGMASTAFDGIVTRDISMTGQFIGKLQYASPEQAQGKRTPEVNGQSTSNGPSSGVDIRSDVYALGVLLYQLLTGGAFPYEVVGNVIDVLHNIIHSKPKLPSEIIAELHSPTDAMVDPSIAVPASRATRSSQAATPIRRNPPLVNETIEAIVLKALEKDPAQRYQSAGELAADIDRYLAGQPTSAVVWSKRPKAASTPRPFLRAATIAASVVLVASLVGVSMNAKTLALWLGLATAAAPVLPTELAPLAPSTAEAAMIEAEFQPDVQATDKRLNKLAEDLALVEAKLSAVSRQLVAVEPKLELPTESKGGPLAFDAFLAKLSQASSDAGRPLQLPAMSREDFDRLVKSEAEAFSRETDKEALLVKRRNLDDQQATLWAQVAYGTFTGREVDRIFRFRAKSLSPMNEASTARSKTIEHGVKVRRLSDNAFRSMGEAPVGDGGPIDLCTRFAAVAEQPKTALVDLRQAVMDGRDANGLTDDDRKSMGELAELARGMTDSLDGAAEAQTRLTKEEGEMARFVNRGRLQQDLLDAASAAARLDQRLVALSKTWQVDVGTASKLGPVVPAVAKRPGQKGSPGNKARPQAAAVPKIVELFPVDSSWSGSMTDPDSGSDFGFTGTVTQASGTSATIQYTNTWGRWEMQVGLLDGRLAVLTTREIEVFKGPLNNRFENIRIDGPLAGVGEQVDLTGTWTVIRSPSNKRENFRTRFVIRNDAPAKPTRPAAANLMDNSLLNIFPVHSRWKGTWKNGPENDDWGDGEVTSNDGTTATLLIANRFARWEVDFTIDAGKLTMLKAVQVSDDFKVPANRTAISDIRISGPAGDAAERGTVKIKGTYDWRASVGNAWQNDWPIEWSIRRQ